jgi:hypothetical protein
MKQWDSVAHLFGTMPEGVEVKQPLPVPPEQEKYVSEREAQKDVQIKKLLETIEQKDRRITQLMGVIEEKEAEDAKTSKRYTEMYKENEATRKEITNLQRQLLEIQAARGIEDTPVAPPPTAYDFDAVAPGVPLPPAVDAVKPEVAEPSRVLTVPLVRDGQVLAQPDLEAARRLVAEGLHSLPWEGLALSHGEPAIPTRVVPPR